MSDREKKRELLKKLIRIRLINLLNTNDNGKK